MEIGNRIPLECDEMFLNVCDACDVGFPWVSGLLEVVEPLDWVLTSTSHCHCQVVVVTRGKPLKSPFACKTKMRSTPCHHHKKKYIIASVHFPKHRFTSSDFYSSQLCYNKWLEEKVNLQKYLAG